MATLPRTEHAVARSLAQTADPRDAYARVLTAIGESLGWRLGAVWEPAPDRPEALRCAETWHAEGIDASDFEAVCRRTAFAPGEGLPGRVWRTGEPAWIPDVTADDNFPRAEAARRAGLHAAFCFPIRSASGLLGAIEFFTAEPREVDAELLATMDSLGDQIGQAAERTFGYRTEDVIGHEMAELIVPPDLRDMHRRGLARYLSGAAPVVLDRRIEITGMRSDGTTFPVELAITRIDVPGPPTFTGYLRDITDRKQFETELRASRARIVAAGDTARRGLERDLHDGAQQRLVELALDLRMARARIDADPDEARDLLDAALDDLDKATSELRELARGIHPAALTEGGLRPALDSLLGRCSVSVRLVAAPEERFPAAVEAAVYFVVAEALTNISRYADAQRAEVEIVRRDGSLSVEVRDDGRGGADTAAGTGLLGLADRLAALDGTLAVDSPSGDGTTLRAEIPCAS